MGAGIEILEKIRFEEKELTAIEERKQSARSVDASKNILLEYEKQQSYIKGLKDALKIIEK